MGQKQKPTRRMVLTGAVTAAGIAPALAAPRISYPGVYTEETSTAPRPIAQAQLSETLFIDDFGLATSGVFTSFADFEAAHADAAIAAEAREQMRLFFLNGGARAAAISVSESQLLSGAFDIAAAIDTRTDIDPGLIAMPVAARLPAGAAGGAYRAALSATKRRFAMLLLDAPATTAPFDANALVADWFDAIAIDDADVAFYAPRLAPTGTTDDAAASGAVAGVIARTDITRGAWKSPAGTAANINGAAPIVDLSTGQQNYLNPLGVNLIRTFPGAGPVIWGSRTLSSDPEWKYVAVRRLGRMIEKSLASGLSWTVFEPNDELLWLRITVGVEMFLRALYREGAFQGVKPEQGYFVQCGRSTTTQADIDNGVVNLQIGFAPLRPAEFIILQLPLKARAA